MKFCKFQDNGLIFFSNIKWWTRDPSCCVFAGGWSVNHTLGLGNSLRLPLGSYLESGNGIHSPPGRRQSSSNDEIHGQTPLMSRRVMGKFKVLKLEVGGDAQPG